MPTTCETSLTVRGDAERLARFLDEIGLDREIEAAARARMARLVERRTGDEVELHLRATATDERPYCGEPIDVPERSWASPAWEDRDLDPPLCTVCQERAESDPDAIWDEWDRRGALSLAAILPPPAHLGGDERYEWVIANWGTKWDLSLTRVCIAEERPGHITLRLDTAWGPPLPVVDELARRAPELLFDVSWDAEPVGANDELGQASWRGGRRVRYEAYGHHELRSERRLDEPLGSG